MIITDIRKEFFEKLSGRILIMCALDVDAICACKILQSLLESYNLQYSVVPVATFDNLGRSFEEYSTSVDYIILLNFGNAIDIPNILKPPKNLTFFVIDSHRPINVFNYYKNPNVKLLITKNEPDLQIPEKNKIFMRKKRPVDATTASASGGKPGTSSRHRDDDADEEEEADIDLLNANPRDLTTEQLSKRQEIRQWLLKKQKLMFEYEEFNYYNRPVSVIIYELAWSLSKDNNYLLWLGVVGLTYQMSSEKIDLKLFEDEAKKLERHIARLKLRNAASANHSSSDNTSSRRDDPNPRRDRSPVDRSNQRNQMKDLFGIDDDNDSLFSDAASVVSQQSRIADPYRRPVDPHRRRAGPSNGNGGNKRDSKSWEIKWQKDLQVDLYRKWTLYDSLWNTQLTACRFKLWNDKGQRNLLEFLVECGLKLIQCKQNYVAMDLDYKKNLINDVEDVCRGDFQDKYNLQDLITKAFVVTCGFKNTFSANDVVLAVRALLESHEPNTTTNERFVRAIQSLSCDDFALLDQGFDAARHQMKSIFEQVKALIVTMKVNDVGIFLHVDLQEQSNISKDFALGNSLMAFARFLLTAYVASKNSRTARRATKMPLVLFAPDYNNEEQTIIVGLPPLAQTSKKNFFGKALQQAAKELDCDIDPDLSETNLIRTNINSKNQILDKLKEIFSG